MIFDKHLFLILSLLALDHLTGARDRVC